jgi:hypothetical protein
LVNESLDQVGDSLLSGRGGVELHLARWNGRARQVPHLIFKRGDPLLRSSPAMPGAYRAFLRRCSTGSIVRLSTAAAQYVLTGHDIADVNFGDFIGASRLRGL